MGYILEGVKKFKSNFGIVTEQIRVNCKGNKRSFATKDYKIIIFDPKCCTKKHFKQVANISL